MKARKDRQSFLWSAAPLLVLALFSLNTPHLRAEEAAVDGAEKEAQAGKSLIQRFLEFTGDKNVMGKAKTGDGKTVLSGNKSKFNEDDGASYKSDLTYHDFSFKTPDGEAAKQDPKNDKAKTRELMPFVSAHGGIGEGGGSSLLERTVYQEHKKYSEKEEDPEQAKKQEEQEGVKYRSVFKITTQEVFDQGAQNGGGAAAAGGGGAAGANGAGAAGGNAGDKKEKDKVERMELRPDVAQKVEEVGTQSAQTIERAARDKGSENDENQMGNVLLYYEAGSRAAAAWSDSTRANLTQRRVFKEVEGTAGQQVTLNEETPTCDKWGQEVQGNIAKIQDPAEKKRAQEEIGKMVEKCKKMAAQPFTAVDPRFKKPEGGGNGGGGDGGEETIKEEGPKKEDPLARDLRNQLTVIEKAGASPSSQPTNWKYEAKDEKSKYSIIDAEGNVTGTEDKTVPQVMEEYNQQLEESIKSYEEVKSVYPELQFDAEKARSYTLKPEEQSAADIMKRPVTQALEEEAQVQAQEEKAAIENYDGLLKKSQQQ